jgi:AcrR family transcriptional regulator
MVAARAHSATDPETRARVLRAATSLFAERGFHGTTMRAIAAAARANVASGHYHFGSKRDLYLEVLRAAFAEVRRFLARGGAQVGEATLARMRRPVLERLLETRVRLMLQNLLGPPPSLHGTLMLREMLDPSDALPVVIAEFIQPMIDEAAAIVRRLAPQLDAEAVTWCVASIMGQALFYRVTRPAGLRIFALDEFTPAYTGRLATHVAAFSLGGIARAAGRAQRRGRRAR